MIDQIHPYGDSSSSDDLHDLQKALDVPAPRFRDACIPRPLMPDLTV